MAEVGEDAALELVISLHRLVRSLRRSRPDPLIPPTHVIVLALLAQYGPLRIGGIAERIPCSQPTATAAVASLESAGLVRREPDPTDGRATRVDITGSGIRTMAQVAHSEAEALAERLGSLRDDEAQQVLGVGQLLRRLADADLDADDPPDTAGLYGAQPQG
jgi:DNA-binding MarR family transcriptional regulator